ncbi:Aste57867_14694 [Aphanomyces stellatus]|uniref:Aste57867_14694 protein n=1 Tax=Aphanomyces stellatus TaxID=120398 RepID=A0A485L2A7_9STRA|nr:hypothetical protein As57867_014639 [Aphanomyces stellatus]VFT91512.1 Aste57867_14694 [Aphanomyces stellatus]
MLRRSTTARGGRLPVVDYNVACKKIQAAYRGWRVRVQLVQNVRQEYEQIIRDIEGEDFIHLLLRCDPTAVEWKTRHLCRPTFVSGFGVDYIGAMDMAPAVGVETFKVKGEDRPDEDDRDSTKGATESTIEGVDRIEEDIATSGIMQYPQGATAKVDIPASVVAFSEEDESLMELSPVEDVSNSTSIAADPIRSSLNGSSQKEENRDDIPSCKFVRGAEADSDRNTQLQILLQLTPEEIRREIQWARRALRERKEFLSQSRK